MKTRVLSHLFLLVCASTITDVFYLLVMVSLVLQEMPPRTFLFEHAASGSVRLRPSISYHLSILTKERFTDRKMGE